MDSTQNQIVLVFSLCSRRRMAYRTRGEYLHFAIFLALADARTCIRGLWYGLNEDERQLVATRAIEHIKKHGDPWNLDKELPPMTGMGHEPPPRLWDDDDQ